MQGVRTIFERVLSDNSIFPPKPTFAEKFCFADDEQAHRLLENLVARNQRHISARTRSLFERLKPLLLERLVCCAVIRT